MAEPYVIRDLSRKAADDASAAVERACRLADGPGEMLQISLLAAGNVMAMAAAFMARDTKMDPSQAAFLCALVVARIAAQGLDSDPREEAVKDYEALQAAGRGVSGPGRIGGVTGMDRSTADSAATGRMPLPAPPTVET